MSPGKVHCKIGATPRFRDQRGLGLIELMVAAGMAAGLMLAMSSMMKYQSNNATRIRLALTREQLINKISNYVVDPVALTNSANSATNSGSPMLKACLLGTSGTTCAAPVPPANAFALFNTATTPVAMTGTSTAPMTYDSWGTPCGTGSLVYNSKCPIIAMTTFTINCGTGCVSGGTAFSFTVTYDIRVLGPTVDQLPRYLRTTTAIYPPLSTTGVQSALVKWINPTSTGTSGITEDSLGNIGIGLTAGSTAQSKLDINGSIKAGGLSPALNTGNLGNSLLQSNDGAWGAYAVVGSSNLGAPGVFLGAGIKQSNATSPNWISSISNATTSPRSALTLDSSAMHLYYNTGIQAALNATVTMTEVFQFNFASQSALKLGAASWGALSDGGLKDVRGPFLRSLDEVEALNPVYYHYKEGNRFGARSDLEYVGLIAQEVRKSIPEAVSEDESGYLRLTPDAIYWTMLNAIKELHFKFKQFKDRLSHFENFELDEVQKMGSDIWSEELEIEKKNQDISARLKKVELK